MNDSALTQSRRKLLDRYADSEILVALVLSGCRHIIAWDRISSNERKINVVDHFNGVDREKWDTFVKHLGNATSSSGLSVRRQIGLDAIDEEIIQDFFESCAKYSVEYTRHSKGNRDLASQFFLSNELACESVDGSVVLTDAGIILCCRSDMIPRGRIHTRLEIISGGSVVLLDGSLLRIRRDALRHLSFLWSQASSSADVRDEAGREVPHFDIPEIAIIEAVTNSLIHRDFGLDDEGWIEVFEDRIEVVNPGVCEISIDELRQEAVKDLRPKYARNNRIIEVTTLARLNNSRGSGIQRIRESLRKNNNLSPGGMLGLDFWNDEAHARFHLVIYRRRLEQVHAVNTASIPETQRVAISRFVGRHMAGSVLGRERELGVLDEAWGGTPKTNLLSVIAWGGVGKTALLAYWVRERFIAKAWRNRAGQPDPLVYFDWTFYDQGTRRDDAHAGAASVGSFFQKALEHFGDPAPDNPQDKVKRLAKRIQQQRSLLVLDGLEPLQYPPHHPQAGQITDPDLRELLGRLAQVNPGLCVVSSRQPLSDFSVIEGLHARQHDLGDLPLESAVELLKKQRVIGTDEELEEAAKDYFCHALSLIVLGRFLVAKGGDIRKRSQIKFEQASEHRDRRITRNAWHVLEAYEAWLASPEGNLADVQALRLTGLFDRPASVDCLEVLRRGQPIAGLTDALVPLSDEAWNGVLRRLEEAHLIQLRFPAVEAGSFAPRPEAREVPVDAHPLIREYFAQRLRTQQGEAFREAHSRLFDHLCKTTDHRPDGLEGLQPLYQAVVHGCLAGRQQEACDKVYFDRICRGNEFYSTRKLGAIGADLGAVAAFFEQPWSRLSANLSATDQARLLNEAAFRLRALGRLTEAREPMRVGGELAVQQEDCKNSAIRFSNLSQLEVTLGLLREGVASARRSVEFADRSGDWGQRMGHRTTAADALHQSGAADERREARALFEEAEVLQRERQPQYNVLYSLQGFQYCDLILAPAERAAWGNVLSRPAAARVASGAPVAAGVTRTAEVAGYAASRSEIEAALAVAEAVRRATKTLPIGERNHWLLDIALDHLTLARVALYRALLEAVPATEYRNPHLDTALDGLRKAGQIDHLPKALLTAAWHQHLLGDDDAARRHLREAQQIAERGPMPLYLADVHLHRARLFRDRAELAKARTLIDKHHYGRRHEELADAESASHHW
jgi:tetratricopeptide (TPR) repeat protein